MHHVHQRLNQNRSPVSMRIRTAQHMHARASLRHAYGEQVCKELSDLYAKAKKTRIRKNESKRRRDRSVACATSAAVGLLLFPVCPSASADDGVSSALILVRALL